MKLDYEDQADASMHESDAIVSQPELEIRRAEGDHFNATYSFLNEDHTLGNLLRN